jgi:hypothetical protein
LIKWGHYSTSSGKHSSSSEGGYHYRDYDHDGNNGRGALGGTSGGDHSSSAHSKDRGSKNGGNVVDQGGTSRSISDHHDAIELFLKPQSSTTVKTHDFPTQERTSIWSNIKNRGANSWNKIGEIRSNDNLQKISKALGIGSAIAGGSHFGSGS